MGEIPNSSAMCRITLPVASARPSAAPAMLRPIPGKVLAMATASVWVVKARSAPTPAATLGSRLAAPAETLLPTRVSYRYELANATPRPIRTWLRALTEVGVPVKETARHA